MIPTVSCGAAPTASGSMLCSRKLTCGHPDRVTDQTHDGVRRSVAPAFLQVPWQGLGLCAVGGRLTVVHPNKPSCLPSMICRYSLWKSKEVLLSRLSTWYRIALEADGAISRSPAVAYLQQRPPISS